MPIIIKNFTWKQTNERILVQVPSYGIHPGKIDIFTSPQYIKAAFKPFFFESVLLHPVDVTESTCVKTSNFIVFDLKKSSETTWKSLEIGLSKNEKSAFKKKLVEEEQERIRKGLEEKSSKKAELKRVAVNEQIQLDTKTRNQIEEIKKAEENKALGDLNKWKRDIELGQSRSDKAQARTSVLRRKTSNSETLMPKLRSTRSLQIIFTPREFPTPSRESRAEEENEYLTRQAEARRSVGFVDKDLRPEEKNPHYLLAKGYEFLKNKNYLGAISAFSFGIKLSPKFVDLYLARSEVQIIIGNFNRAVEDCTNALGLLKPSSPINLHERAISYGRRGLALYKLGLIKQGISELEASVKLDRATEFESILEECQSKFDEMLPESK